jgi:hypothetical protein
LNIWGRFLSLKKFCRHEKSMNKYAAWIQNQIFVDIFFRFAVQINWNKFWFRRLNFSREMENYLNQAQQKCLNLNFVRFSDDSPLLKLLPLYVTKLSQ